MAHGHVHRLAGKHLRRHVVQHAVAHVDCVLQTNQPRRCPMCQRAVLEGLLAADAGGRVIPGRRQRRRCLVRAAAVHVRERIDAGGREHHAARLAKGIRHHIRHAHIHRPGECGISRRAELVPGHENQVGCARQPLQRRALEQVAGDAFNALRLELLAQALFGEARHADHAPFRHGALGHAQKRRPHLAADTENQDVAGRARQVGGERGRRARHELFQRRHIFEVNHPVNYNRRDETSAH